MCNVQSINIIFVFFFFVVVMKICMKNLVCAVYIHIYTGVCQLLHVCRCSVLNPYESLICKWCEYCDFIDLFLIKCVELKLSETIHP